MDLEHAEDHGEDIRVDTGLRGGETAGTLVAEVDQVGLEEAVPEEAVVGALPEGHSSVLLGLPLEAVGEVERVREVHGPVPDESAQQGQETVLVGVADLSLAKGKKLCGDNLVDGVATELADGLRFRDEDDILV